MRNLRKHLLLGGLAAVLCLSAFVITSSAQRYRGGGWNISFSIGSGHRGYYPRHYRYAPRRVYRPAPVYYSNYGYYNPGYYNSGYYAPAYNSGYYVSPRRRHHRGHGRNCRVRHY